jgi:hypothetical protein
MGGFVNICKEVRNCRPVRKTHIRMFIVYQGKDSWGRSIELAKNADV